MADGRKQNAKSKEKHSEPSCPQRRAKGLPCELGVAPRGSSKAVGESQSETPGQSRLCQRRALLGASYVRASLKARLAVLQTAQFMISVLEMLPPT